MHSALQLQNGPSSVASPPPPTSRADAEAASPPPAACKDSAEAGEAASSAAAVISVEEAAAAVRAVVHSDAPPSAQAINVHPGTPQEEKGELDPVPTSEVTAEQDSSLTLVPAASPSAPVVENKISDEAESTSSEVEIKSEETINDPLAASDDSTCHNCWATFPSLNELVVHLKKQHVQTHRICRPCQLFTFLNDLDFEKHHQKHVFDRRLSIRLEVLDTNSLPPFPAPCRAVARKRTAPQAAAPPPQREPIKLTLRLTTGRQAKAAEERHEAARRAEMLTATEKTSTSSPTTKEEALFEKAITELYNNVDTGGKASPAQGSPTPSFVLRYSPSPPASTTSTDQQSESGTNSRPPSAGVMPTATIAVRSTESLQENPGASIDTDALLRNMLDKMTSPQTNVQEPEFVSLERLAGTVGSLIGSPPIPTTSVTSTDPSAAVVTSQAVPLRNLAAMQPSTMLPNLLINAHATNTMNSMNANQIPTTYGQQVPTTYAGPHYPQSMQSFVCDVCNTRWPNMIALDAHRAASGHYRCLTCNLVFPSNQALAGHSQSTHGHMPQHNSYLQSNVRNPPPLYRGPVPNMPQNYNQAMPPPLVYQQQQQQAQYRPGMLPQQRPLAPRLDQFRAAPPRAPPPGYNVPQRQPGPQQPVLRNVLQQPPVNQQQQQQMGTPTKRPAPPNGASPPIKAKRPEIPARQPEDCQIIAVQRSGDGVPQIQSVQGSTSIPTTSPAEKPANTIVQLTNEITLSVKPSAADATKKVAQKAGANVASLLANRGITVTTSAKSKSNESAARNTPPAQNPAIPESLSMNSSISILPASRSNSSATPQQSSPAGNFAVPRARPSPTQPAASSNPERPPRPPTVDLTSETQSSSHMRRSPLTCTVCQRPMPTSIALQQHMQVHHPQHAQQQQQASAAQQQAQQNKLPYRCPHCPASYPTVQGLQAHRQSVHKEVFPPPASPSDMGIPVVDLRAAGTVERLSRLGIHHYIPLPAQNSSGFFSIPIISAEMSRNPAIFSLQAMNATSVMPFGPLRALPR
ncbi:hypothetical protein B566_EDAN008141 [Ephemera danica]|nr:hypothetical protein B566_EDAN008141 [Ephemera danica]